MAENVVRRVSNINDLPDEMLCRIISLIPIKEAVRTSVLSRRWKHLFTLISNLDIAMEINEEEELSRFMDFVDRLVFFRDKSSVLRFSLSCRGYIDPHRLDKWICALVEQHKITQLDLRTANKPEEGLRLPDSLFLCESLVVLKLTTRWNYNLKVPSRVFLPRLKALFTQGIGFANDGDRLFSSCPALETLGITGCHIGEGCVNFSISNQNLKGLSLNYIHSQDERVVPIVVKAPNLAFLNYNLRGCNNHSLVLLDVKSLVRAVITSSSIAPNVLKGIQNIQTLNISSCILQDLQHHNTPIPVFSKLTSLKSWDWKFESGFNGLEYFMSRCVVLETLELKELLQFSTGRDTDIQFALPQSPPICLSSHLKTVEIRFERRKRAEPLMALFTFFLKNGKVLEELKICGNFIAPAQRLEIMRELSSFPSVSENCKVTFSAN